MKPSIIIFIVILFYLTALTGIAAPLPVHMEAELKIEKIPPDALKFWARHDAAQVIIDRINALIDEVERMQGSNAGPGERVFKLSEPDNAE